MASLNKFNCFVENLAEKVHNLGSDQLKVALTNSAPAAANTILTDISEVSYANCSSRNITTSTSAQTSGTYKLVLADLVLTATGTVGPFRYVVLYNDTATNDPLIGWYDLGASWGPPSNTMANGDTLLLDFDGSAGVLTIA